jgi:hypothetical protein
MNAVDWDVDRDWDWRSAATDRPEDLYGRWREAVGRSRAVFAKALAARGLDRPGISDPDDCSGVPALRYVLLNLIEEYAHHNGHADLIRESVDGLVGHDPPG